MLHTRYRGLSAAFSVLLFTFVPAHLSAQAGSSRTAVPQTGAPPAAGRAEASDTATLGRGWNALASGRAPDALAAADQILRRIPWSHPAITLRIEALAAGDAMGALDAYEAWLGGRTIEDPGLLEPVARAVLTQIARDRHPDLAREAVKLLTEARVPLPSDLATTSAPGDGLAADGALAAAGDAGALQRLAEAAASPAMRDKALVAQALEAAGPAGAPALERMLGDRGAPNRAAAADALGRLGAGGAVGGLQQAFKDPDPLVHSSAAVALARLKDPEGQAYVQQMLQSDVPDLRLAAAEAWNGQDGPWVAAIRPLLDNRDGLNRIRAARLIAPVDPESSRRTLREAAADPNPVMRAESGRTIAALAGSHPASADMVQLRRLLRDDDGAVRVPAAGALMVLARSGR